MVSVTLPTFDRTNRSEKLANRLVMDDRMHIIVDHDQILVNESVVGRNDADVVAPRNPSESIIKTHHHTDPN